MQIQTRDIFGPQSGLPFKASEMMSGVGGVYASVKAKHCNTAREGHFGESAPTKPQVGGWVEAVHRIWVTFGVPVRGTSQICLRGRNDMRIDNMNANILHIETSNIQYHMIYNVK